MNKVHFYLIWVLTTPFNEEESSISEQMKVLGFISKYKTNNISVQYTSDDINVNMKHRYICK